MIRAAAIVCLHIDGCLIRLDVAPRKQLALDRSNHGHQHLSDGHHPAAHGGAADVDPRVTQQDDALTIERRRKRSFYIAILPSTPHASRKCLTTFIMTSSRLPRSLRGLSI